MTSTTPALPDIEQPQMPDHSPRVASTMLDCSLDLLTDPVHFYSAAYSSLAGLGDHISRTTLPWPDAMDDPALQNLSCDIFPPSVSAEVSEAQIAHFGRDAIVDPHLLESIKVEDGYTSASSPEYDTASHSRSSSGVDSLVQTIQTKSERRLSSVSSCSFPDPVLSQSSARTKRPQLEQDHYDHNCRRALKPHQCSVASCTKTFHQKSHLEIHIRAHSGYKPFVRWGSLHVRIAQVLKLTPWSVALQGRNVRSKVLAAWKPQGRAFCF